MRTRFFRALWSLYASFFQIPMYKICQIDPFRSLWFLWAHCQGLVLFHFANQQKKNFSFGILKKGTHKFANWDPNKISMHAMWLCCFSPLAHFLHAAWPVSERGLDYITMCALRLPIEVPFHVFVRIVILMRKRSADRGPFMRSGAVLPECQCANGECRAQMAITVCKEFSWK